jgi:hypothetical protein
MQQVKSLFLLHKLRTFLGKLFDKRHRLNLVSSLFREIEMLPAPFRFHLFSAKSKLSFFSISVRKSSSQSTTKQKGAGEERGLGKYRNGVKEEIGRILPFAPLLAHTTRFLASFLLPKLSAKTSHTEKCTSLGKRAELYLKLRGVDLYKQ